MSENFCINMSHDIILGFVGMYRNRLLNFPQKRFACRELQNDRILLFQPLPEIIPKASNDAVKVCDNISSQHFDKESVDDMELESQSEMDSKSSRDSNDTDLKPSDLKCEK